MKLIATIGFLVSTLVPGVPAQGLAAQGRVLVVDAANGPGTDFTDLPDAIAAAANGDILLVRSGFYGDARVDGKSLAIVADTLATVHTTKLIVQSLPLGTPVLVRGLDAEPTVLTAGTVSGTQSPVWLEDCDFRSTLAPVFFIGGLEVVDASCLALARCGIPHPSTFGITVDALSVLHSRVHVHQSYVTGANEGQDAIHLEDSFLEFEGSTATGGAGDPGNLLSCNGGPGGDALTLGPGSLAVLLDSTTAGGQGGPPFGACLPGPNGRSFQFLGGMLSFLAGKANGYKVTSPVRDDESVSATITGTPGDLAWILFSSEPAPGLTSPQFDGELHVGTPRGMFFAGTIPGTGMLTVGGPTPPLPAGKQGTLTFSQAVVRNMATGRFRMGAPSALVIVDSAF